MEKKYISQMQFRRAIVWVSLLMTAIVIAIGFWIYNTFYTIEPKLDDGFITQSFDNNYCFDRYDYLDTNNISYYKGYSDSQLMSKNMQDLSTLIVYAENNNLPVDCPDDKVCDLNKDNKIDSGDLRFLETLIRDIDQDDRKLASLLISHGLPVECN